MGNHNSSDSKINIDAAFSLNSKTVSIMEFK